MVRFVAVADSKNLGEYRVEGIDYEKDGEIYVAIFSGPDAESRAQRYATWMNAD